MNRFFHNPCNRYFLLWVLFNLKGFLYPDGSIINQGILIFILLISFREFIYFLKYERYRQHVFFNSLNIVMIMYSLYGVVLLLTDGLNVRSLYGDIYSSLSFIQGPLIVLTPIYVIYLYTKRGYLTTELLQKWMAVFLLVGVAQYFTSQRQILMFMMSQGDTRSEFTNGAAYTILALIPGMLVYKKKLIYYIGIAVCVIFIVMAMKRGAILTATLSLMIIILHDLKTAKGSNKIAVIIIIIVGIFLLIKFVNHMLEVSEYFNARIEATLEGNSSERDIIYKKIWMMYLNDSDLFQLIFGRGAMSTLKYGNIYAHNDWLEILFCHGIIGWGIFINFLRGFYLSSNSKSLTETSRFVLFLIWSIVFVKTFFTMSIIGISIYSTIMIGFSLADGFRYCKREFYEKN